MADIYKGDLGIKLILDVGVDISSATRMSILYRKPYGGTGTWAAVMETGTSVSYTSLTDEFNEVGIWKVQARVTTPLWTQSGAIAKVNVLPAL